MSQRLRGLPLLLTMAVAVVGLLVFVGGVALEFIVSRNRTVIENATPFLGLALAGFCLAASMALLWFGIVGVALAKQTRALGSGYGDAYRLIEAFRFRDAIPLLERSIEEGKETTEVLMLLTSAYAFSGQLAKAQATADRAVQLFPDDPDAYVTLANGYRMQALYEEAVAALRRAASLAPKQPVVLAELGFMQRFAGDEQSAQVSFEQAAQQDLPDPYRVRVYYHLAQAYQQMGDAVKAARATARMMSARGGLAPWRSGLRALEGTAYGQALAHEISAIEVSIKDADAGQLRQEM
jgi:tetratricopeptide (TPR) repeat protein